MVNLKLIFNQIININKENWFITFSIRLEIFKENLFYDTSMLFITNIYITLA
jgi:hypothetical protein